VHRRAALLLAAAAVAAVAAPARATDRPPDVAAAAVIVANGATGEVLYARNADARLPMASITKIMTALVTLERVRPDAVVTVPAEAVGIGESSIELKEGEPLTVRQLLEGLLVPSANDAAFALASYVGSRSGGSGAVPRFVGYMNAKAASLGLANTHYERPDGLDAPGHYSSARDILRLARQAMRKPLFRELVGLRTATIPGRPPLRTSNDLLGVYRGAIGVKTGFTAGCGWCEVAAARRGGVTIYAVLLGAPGRVARDAGLERLLDWGFAQYGRYELVTAGKLYATAAVPFSDERLRLVARGPARAIVRVERPHVQRVVAPVTVALPVRRGETLGSVCVDLGKSQLCRPLVADRDVPGPGLGTRLRWYAGRAVDHAGDLVTGVLGAIF
jgi:D-alanyl-D-alanine carboxypeptidase (penicillin-binding protein 5/6)